MPAVDEIADNGAVTGDLFRAVLGHVPTSVAIVAGVVAGDPKGLSVGTFVPVSLEPPLVGFFVDRKSTSWPAISPVGAFCVSILAADQVELSRRFAISNSDKFTGVPWHAAPSGHPVIEGAVAWGRFARRGFWGICWRRTGGFSGTRGRLWGTFWFTS